MRVCKGTKSNLCPFILPHDTMGRRRAMPAGERFSSPPPLKRHRRWWEVSKRLGRKQEPEALLRRTDRGKYAAKKCPHKYMAGPRPEMVWHGEWLRDISRQMRKLSYGYHEPLTPCVAYHRLQEGPVPPHEPCQTEVSFKVVLKGKRARPTGEANSLNRLPKGSVGRVCKDPL